MAVTSYLIAINGIYLTSDGTASGKRCRSEVFGIDLLSTNYAAQIFRDMHGNPLRQQTNVGVKGKSVSIRIEGLMPSTDMDDIIAEIVDGELNHTPLTLVGTGADTPNFSLYALPDYPPWEFREGSGFGEYKNVTLNFVATGIYTPAP